MLRSATNPDDQVDRRRAELIAEDVPHPRSPVTREDAQRLLTTLESAGTIPPATAAAVRASLQPKSRWA